MKYMVTEAKSENLAEVEKLLADLDWKKLRSNHWVSDTTNLHDIEVWLRDLRWKKQPMDNVWMKGKHRVSLVVSDNKANAYIGM